MYICWASYYCTVTKCLYFYYWYLLRVVIDDYFVFKLSSSELHLHFDLAEKEGRFP